MKFFEIKHYSRLGKYKQTINPRDILSEISFSEDIDGGQGSLNLEIIGNSSHFLPSDIIEIRETRDGSFETFPVYSGVIESITIEEYANHDKITLELLGLVSILTDIFFKNNDSAKFSKANYLSDFCKQIIDNFNEEYGSLHGDTQNIQKNIIRYDEKSFPDRGEVLYLEFDYINHLEAIKKVLENSPYSFFIDSTGYFSIRNKNQKEEVFVTLGRDIENFTHTQSKRDMCNYCFFAKKNNDILRFGLNESIEKFGKKEQTYSDESIVDYNTQRKKGQEFVEKNGIPSHEIILQYLPDYNKNITPNHCLTLLNSRTKIIKTEVTKIDKTEKLWTIHLGKVYSFGEILTQKNNPR